MANIGINVEADVVDQYKSLDGKYGYVQIKISDDKSSAVVDQVVKQDKRTTEEEKNAYDEFLKQLPSDDCRYVVYNYHVQIEGNDRIKRGFISWSPKGANVRTRMIYTSTKDTVRKKLVGISMEIIAESTGDLDYGKVTTKNS